MAASRAAGQVERAVWGRIGLRTKKPRECGERMAIASGARDNRGPYLVAHLTTEAHMESLSLRDQFAIAAFEALANAGRLQRCLGAGDFDKTNFDTNETHEFAKAVWRVADLVLSEREHGREGGVSVL
jgi:hypothetical protein